MPLKRIAFISFLVIQAIVTILFFINKHNDFAYETVIIMVGVAYLAYISSRYKLWVPDYVIIIVLLSLSSHNILGYLLNLYVISNMFDKCLHIFGTFSFSLLGYFYLRIYDLALTGWRKFVITMMIGLSLAAIYELVEFAMDYFIKPDVPAQSGLMDTNLDLLGDLVGAFLAGFYMTRK